MALDLVFDRQEVTECAKLGEDAHPFQSDEDGETGDESRRLRKYRTLIHIAAALRPSLLSPDGSNEIKLLDCYHSALSRQLVRAGVAESVEDVEGRCCRSSMRWRCWTFDGWCLHMRGRDIR